MSFNQSKMKNASNDNDSNYNIEIGDKGSDNKQIFDLNEIFHIDLSYNFDLLKNLLSTIIKNQKLKDEKITELENQILDLRIAFNENQNKKPEKKKERKSIKTEEKIIVPENVKVEDSSYQIKPPKRAPKLEISDDNQPIINKIIVSIYIII